MQIGRPHKLAAGMMRCALCVLSMTGLSLIGLSFLAGPAMAKTVFWYEMANLSQVRRSMG